MQSIDLGCHLCSCCSVGGYGHNGGSSWKLQDNMSTQGAVAHLENHSRSSRNLQIAKCGLSSIDPEQKQAYQLY